MRIYEMAQRPSALPAARIPATHEAIVGRPAYVAVPAPTNDRHRISVSAIGVGGVLPVAKARFTAQASGVPPRGRPV